MEGMSFSLSGVFLDLPAPVIATFGHYTAELASSDLTRRDGAAPKWQRRGGLLSLRESRRPFSDVHGFYGTALDLRQSQEIWGESLYGGFGLSLSLFLSPVSLPFSLTVFLSFSLSLFLSVSPSLSLSRSLDFEATCGTTLYIRRLGKTTKRE